jgi:Uma2 family endonuclease
MSALVDEALNSPRLPIYVEQLERALADERQRRERFYEEVTEESKAEFINGQVVMHSPAKYQHTNAVQNLLALLRAHVQRHQLGWVGGEKVLVCLTRNDYEPDVVFFGREKAAQFTKRQMKFPAPDLAVEVVSESTEHMDRNLKFEDYAAHGVREYWIVDPETERVEQYELIGEQYQLRVKADSGELRSLVVTGLVIPVRAIFDPAENLTALRKLAG